MLFLPRQTPNVIRWTTLLVMLGTLGASLLVFFVYGGLCSRASLALDSAPAVADALARDAPLAQTSLGFLRKFTDHDKDGYAASALLGSLIGLRGGATDGSPIGTRNVTLTLSSNVNVSVTDSPGRSGCSVSVMARYRPPESGVSRA